MRNSFFLVALILIFNACEWRPDEVAVERAATLIQLNIAVGDTIMLDIQPEGSDFSEILNQDSSIVEIIDHMHYNSGSQLILIGKGEGVVDLYFNYEVLVAPDSPPLTAKYFIHLSVTESIPLFLNVGEEYALNFSTDLSSEQLNALDSVAVIAVQEIPGGAISVEHIPGDQTMLSLTGESPGTTELIIEGYDASGDQIVSLFYEIEISIHKVVLAEMFTNTGCVNCPEANHYLDNISVEYLAELAIVRYHVNWTDPFDPMNLYNPGDVETRRAYYNIFAAPGLVLDGTLVSSLDEDDWSGRVLNASRETPPIFISPIDVLVTIDSLYLEFDLNAFGLRIPDLSIRSVVLEDSIEYAGSNGETLHMQVMRDMASSSLGSLNNLSTIQHSLKKPDNYELAGPMGILVFVQSEADKAILQARKQQLD